MEAALFPGMQFIPLIVLGLAIIVFIAFTVAISLLLRTALPKQAKRMRFVATAITGVLFIVFLVWQTSFVPPFELPPGAKHVRIDCAMPFTLAIDDNLRFQIPPEEFRTWMETLFKMPWESLRTSTQEIRLEAVVDGRYATPAIDFEGRSHQGEDFQPPSNFREAGWLDARGLKNGFWIKGTPSFSGDLLYDSDRELVYYRFWD